MELGPDDLAALGRAKGLLETTSLAVRLANAVGTPVDKLLGALPNGATQMVMRATNKSITVALDVALSTLGDSHRGPRQWQHKAVVALAKSVTEAVEYIAKQGIADRGAPAVVKLVSSIAARFGVRVSQKAMAQLVPVIGAAGGAFMNVIFMDHYQDVAKGHFVVRRLERQFGAEVVKDAYLRL
jgi:hypothetical protein